ALKSADAVVADSEYLLSEARKLAPLKQTLVSPLGIEKKYLELHRKSYELSRPLKIIIPRPHEAVYNNLFILQSLSTQLKTGQISLTLPDFGSLVNEFKFHCRTLNITGVSFYRRCEREEFLKLMSTHDVYLSASRSDSSPVSLIEAMALGLIPVVAKIPGIEEWAKDSGALTFEQVNSDELVSVIKEIISGSTLEDMHKKNLERVRSKAIYEDNIAARIEMMKQLEIK
ncbi:MAG TPA: glycosyltransferase, partial [candidate division Zixibacteria bacterium]|nr:glycosyltransferase [candidate division Zixibacteria bacterium]